MPLIDQVRERAKEFDLIGDSLRFEGVMPDEMHFVQDSGLAVHMIPVVTELDATGCPRGYVMA